MEDSVTILATGWRPGRNSRWLHRFLTDLRTAAEQRIYLRPNTGPILGNPTCWAQLKGTPLVHTTAA